MELLLLLALVSLFTSAYAVREWFRVPRQRPLALLVLATAVGFWNCLYGGMFYVLELLYFVVPWLFHPDPLSLLFALEYVTFILVVAHLVLSVLLMWKAGRYVVTNSGGSEDWFHSPSG
jgi:hypothetical protein